MTVRYQVFVSSTYLDLIDERRMVVDAILRMGHIPAGMELFPASNERVWETIRKTIDASDYYVLIIGGRYGSMYKDRKSFTEHEYEYAHGEQIPILPFLLEEPIATPGGSSRAARQRLARFRKRLRDTHSTLPWRDASDLVQKVGPSLTRRMNDQPRIGWVRAVRPEAAPLPAAPIAAPAPQPIPGRLVLPGGFDPAAARDVLAGKADRIASFAVWNDTPQGHAFWSAQKKRLDTAGRVTTDARDAILQWLDEAERTATPSPDPLRT